MEAGIDQLLRYANRRKAADEEGAERLFHYNLMMVSTHRYKASVGTITSPMDHFLQWKDPYPLTQEQVMTGGQQEEPPKPLAMAADTGAPYSGQNPTSKRC